MFIEMNRPSVVVFDHYCGVDVATKLGSTTRQPERR